MALLTLFHDNPLEQGAEREATRQIMLGVALPLQRFGFNDEGINGLGLHGKGIADIPRHGDGALVALNKEGRAPIIKRVEPQLLRALQHNLYQGGHHEWEQECVSRRPPLRQMQRHPPRHSQFGDSEDNPL